MLLKGHPFRLVRYHAQVVSSQVFIRAMLPGHLNLDCSALPERHAGCRARAA